MPTVRVDDGVNLHYEESGQGMPLVFVHEFAGDHRSWHLQMRFFSRRYRAIAFNARGYPPSDVLDDVKAYSQERAAEDIRGVLDGLRIPKAHVCGLSMGGYALLRVRLYVVENVRRRIAARVEGDRAVAAGEEAHLEMPAPVIAGELVDEDQRQALPRFLVVD